jgi:hypothetical protein
MRHSADAGVLVRIFSRLDIRLARLTVLYFPVVSKPEQSVNVTKSPIIDAGGELEIVLE